MKSTDKKKMLMKKTGIALCFVICLFFSSLVSADEFSNVSGDTWITSNTTLSGEKAIRQGDLTINPGVVLEILPDSSLQFEPGHQINISTGSQIFLFTGSTILKGTVACDCLSGDCCDGCNYKSSGSQPTGYTDDTDGFCTGTEGPTTTSYVYTRDYYCNGTDADMHYADTLKDTCGTCEYCVNNSLSCAYYGTGTVCGSDSRSCSVNNYYYISGTQSPTTTSYCKYRSYSGSESVNINCNGSGSCSNYQTWSGCASYSDSTLATCGTCQYVACSSSVQTCSNYGPTNQCLAAGSWACDTNCKASRLLASYCSGGTCPTQTREYKYATSNGQVCKNGDFVSATCLDYCNRGAPYVCQGQQPRDNAYGCAAGADSCSVGIGECGYGSACLGTCSSWCLNGVCGNAPNGTSCTDDGNSCTQDYCSIGTCTHPNYCSLTDTSCGCTSCTNCDSSDGWENVGSSYACCDGSYAYTCQDQQYRDYYCQVPPGTSCTSTITSTRTVKSGGTYCSYGCSSGQCNQCSANEHCGSSWVCSSSYDCMSYIRPICVSGTCQNNYSHYDPVCNCTTINAYRIDTACTSRCNDYNECTNDYCNANGTCGHSNKTNGTACSGGTCQNGSCCQCTSGPCCDGCNYKSSGSQPTGYTDDADGFCTGTEGPTTTSYVYTRDYYCNGTDANMHQTDTLKDTCGTCEYCVNNSLSCAYYGTGTVCGSDSRSCSVNNYYYISGTQSPTTTSYCKYRSYSGSESVNINCNGSGSCSNYQTWSGCSSYSDSTLATCGTCKWVQYCNSSAQSCGNYSSTGYLCGSAGSWTCSDSKCKATRTAAPYCSSGNCVSGGTDEMFADSSGQVCSGGSFSNATCVSYCNRGAPYTCLGQQPRDNAYGCAAGADSCSVGIGECGYGSACLGTCNSWCLNGVCGNAPNGTSCTGGTCQNGVCCQCTSGDCCDGCNFRGSGYDPSGTCRKCTGSSATSVYQTSSEDIFNECSSGFASCYSKCTMTMRTGNCSGSSASCGTYQQYCDIYTACGAGGCSSSYRCGTWDYCHSSSDAYWNNFVCGPNTGRCNYVTDLVNCPACQQCPGGTYGSCQNYPNGTQDNTSPNYCNGTCQACQNGSCGYATSGTACPDDGYSCTNDYCDAWGTCTHPVKSGTCRIAGVCYNNGAINPSNSCQVCNNTGGDSQWYWSNMANGTACTDDGNGCTYDQCSSGSCTHSAKPNGTACQNGGTCQNGCCTCQYSRRDCCLLQDGVPTWEQQDDLESTCNGCDWGSWDYLRSCTYCSNQYPGTCSCTAPVCDGVNFRYDSPACQCIPNCTGKTCGQSDDCGGICLSFYLFQNYPNPFDSQTTISFCLGGESYFTLTILDSNKNPIEVLAQGTRGAGRYYEKWNAGSRPSGTYYYRLVAGGFAKTRKMLLLK